MPTTAPATESSTGSEDGGSDTGDGLLAVFDGPAGDPLAQPRFCTSFQGWVDVRAGLHTGECDRRGDDISGIAVNIAARIMALAGPGEVLVSRTVNDLIAGSQIALADRGSTEL